MSGRQEDMSDLYSKDDSVNELAQSLYRSLGARGTLSTLRARLRADAYHELAGGSESHIVQRAGKLPPETVLTNELVREHLQRMGYKHALSVLESEAALGSERLSRSFLAREVGLSGEQSQLQLREEEEALPLLLLLVAREQRRARADAFT